MKQTAMEKNRLEEVSSPRASERAAGTVEGANGHASLIWGNLGSKVVAAAQRQEPGCHGSGTGSTN